MADWVMAPTVDHLNDFIGRHWQDWPLFWILCDWLLVV